MLFSLDKYTRQLSLRTLKKTEKEVCLMREHVSRRHSIDPKAG